MTGPGRRRAEVAGGQTELQAQLHGQSGVEAHEVRSSLRADGRIRLHLLRVRGVQVRSKLDAADSALESY